MQKPRLAVTARFLLAILFVLLSTELSASCEQNSSHPSISVSVAGPDPSGQGSLIVTFSFPSTTSASERKVDVRGNNTLLASEWMAEASGTRTYAINFACWRTGTYTIDAYATACQKWGDPNYSASASTSVVLNTKPTVSASVINPSASGQGSVTVT
jgi:hypothetical protein